MDRNMMKTIVITGSTRGIGFGLSQQFLEAGHSVVISGRHRESVQQAFDRLRASFPGAKVLGVPCDMTDFNQVENLWKEAVQHFDKVDIWINNAGIAQSQTDFWDLTPAQIQALIDTNITGAMFGAKVALAGMLQQGRGAFYNMEGMGSDGRWVEGLTLYGTSKRALNYLTDSLVKEVAGTGVIVGALRPGMVLTDLILKRYEGKQPDEWENARKVFNILADRVETVVPFLAERVLNNQKNGALISWLSGGKVLWRFLTAGLRKRDLFEGL
jgi:NAD(P)-dependent dehydrogenase (short-subunit alcohol dehydrogenase family)